jgi:hypothetical protein
MEEEEEGDAAAAAAAGPPPVKAFSCPSCNTETNYIRNLRRHWINHHDGNFPNVQQNSNVVLPAGISLYFYFVFGHFQIQFMSRGRNNHFLGLKTPQIDIERSNAAWLLL